MLDENEYDLRLVAAKQHDGWHISFDDGQDDMQIGRHKEKDEALHVALKTIEDMKRMVLDAISDLEKIKDSRIGYFYYTAETRGEK